MGLDEVSNYLKNEKIISNSLIFKLWILCNFLENKLKFGEYLIPNQISVNELAEIIVNGKSINHSIIVKEGSTQFELISNLKENKMIKEDFDKSMIPEIILADTYFYTKNDSPYDIFNFIGNQSKSKIENIWNQRDTSIPIQNLKQLFIISSIIEKETGKKTEKSMIARVFYNRLKKGMRLQSDPTVIYSITEGKKFNRKLLRKDLKYKSKFNTYVIKGLPPHAISYPSSDTIIAASKPYKNNFLYFVADGSGGHLFSETYKGHLKNIKNIKKKNDQ